MAETTANGPGDYHIAAQTSPAERGALTLKHGDSFAVFDRFGDMRGGPGRTEGLYHLDTRHLSQLELAIDGRRPLLLSSTMAEDDIVLTTDLTNPDVVIGDQVAIRRDSLHLSRSKLLWQGAWHERLAIRNFAERPHPVRISLHFGADFADLFEARGTTRERRGTTEAVVATASTVRFEYLGLDQLRRTTTLSFTPAPTVLTSGLALWELMPQPGECLVVFVDIACNGETSRPRRRQAFFAALHQSRRAARDHSRRTAAIRTPDAIVAEVLDRAQADVAMLLTATPQGLYPYAGIPWFSTAFGRDGLLTAMELLWVQPDIGRDVLRYLAANQATQTNAAADAEPGKILHETRAGEMARLGEVPFARYYGSVDSTPLFVMLAGAYWERTGDLATIEQLWPNIQAALSWIDGPGDRDGDGFVEYYRKTERGLANQGWKDSEDSVFHADGRLAEGPIALVEVQAYVWAARRAAAVLARALGMTVEAAAQERAAAALAEQFESAFWCPEIGTYALALDGDKRPCRVRSSNPGHALFCGLPAPERAAMVADTMMAGDGFSGWGVRTIASGQARYNPMSYHDGSIWPHDNALIALGLARYGHGAAAKRIMTGLFEAATYFDLRRLPELFCGFPRRHGRGPTSYPVACAPQAWAAATPFALIQACLGVSFDAARREIRLNRPSLPAFLDQLEIRRLALGDAWVDLLLRGNGSDVAVHVTRREGEVSVVTTA